MYELHDAGDDATALPDPTRCYVQGCDHENEILLHVATQPDRYANLCYAHAGTVIAKTLYILKCPCPFCARARKMIDL